VFALVFLGTAGLWVELLLLRHAESATQWIPHVALAIGLITTIAAHFRPRRGVLRFFQAVMLLFLVIGALGVYLHYRGNVEFATERDPSLTGLRLLWKALRGATPSLAPGALAQIGLLGLVFTYRHPALTDGSEPLD
jgi:hypothetical protein